jgi:hypothetical protein
MIRKTSTILVTLTIMALLTACGTAQTATPATSTSTFVMSATGTATAESTSEIPVTGETATATPEVNASPATTVQTPAPMGQKLESEAQWEAVALELAQAAGFTTVESELYQLPSNTSWDSTLAYYQAQAAAAGWGDAPAQTNEIAGGHSAIWNVTIDGTTHYFVVAQLDSAEGSFTVNLFGH